MTIVAQAHERLEANSYSVLGSLRDGRRIEIRALRPTDRDDLLSAVGGISESSSTRRFFGAKRHFSQKEVAYFVDVDFVTHVALVAVADEGRGAIIAGGRHSRAPQLRRSGLRGDRRVSGPRPWPPADGPSHGDCSRRGLARARRRGP